MYYHVPILVYHIISVVELEYCTRYAVDVMVGCVLIYWPPQYIYEFYLL